VQPNDIRGIGCVMPPSPELEQRILRAKSLLQSGGALPAKASRDSLDLRSLSLILGRPPRTRPNTFIDVRPEVAPVTGTRRALVLLVDFSDKAATQTQAHFSDMLFSVGTYATGSMRDFYREASYTQLDVIGVVSGAGGPTAGWYRAPQPKSFYTDGNYGFNGYPKNAQRLVEDVVALADPNVNFADYDNDGDGIVDALVVICAGTGGEQTGNVNDIWSHKWNITPQVRDGVKIDRYFMAPEDGRVGVMAHELGHLLMGWPDLYDTDYSSAGTGRWDLMAAGSWNGGGDRPAHPTLWCKTRVEWVTPTVIWNATQSVTLPPYASNSVGFKLPIGSVGSQEYFLLSNRQQAGFDTALPGEGLLIEHVDDAKNNNTDENHYLVDIEQADGQRHLNLNANRGDATDPYPTATNAAFSGSTTPNSNAYSGAASNVEVTNVARSGDNVTADIKVGAGGVAARQWFYNRKVTSTFAGSATQWAWAYVDGVGWRRINGGSADGVTNMFLSLCEAAANGRLVHAEADGQLLYTMYLV
jgi:immune inhibitor A